MQPASLLPAHGAERQRIGLEIAGRVQGVGFRPFVWRLAADTGLGGFVRNTHAGVSLEVEGSPQALEGFLTRLDCEAPPHARIERLTRTPLAPTGEESFAILSSSADGAPSATVLPDLAVCDACLAEIADPGNRRYRYPFTTCMHCGPRYSLIEALPYDRERTAMRHFPMCPACRAEYGDPASRRFHAETNACPECGPQLALHGADGALLAAKGEALEQAAEALRSGRIVALKGLGGFQLLADARNEAAVARLRQRKHRPAKPFAVMVGSLAEAQMIAHVSALEAEWLLSSAAPIVLLSARGDAAEPLAPAVAPGNPDIGLMLPCTPLHHLLMGVLGFPVIATSGNRSGEPLAASDAEAFARLSGIADLFLTHDRPILHPVDDSVLRVIDEDAVILRSARGCAPLVLADSMQSSPGMALGGHLKNSVALAAEGKIVLGPHIGDLGSAESRAAFARGVTDMAALYGIRPAWAACDAHPDYHSTHAAEGMGLPVRKAPHHLAHVLAGMIDNALDGPVLGMAWDGTGHGGDGTVWGGEFLAVQGDRWRRVAHLLPFRLPGGEAAVRDPNRAALGTLHAAYGEGLWTMDGLMPLAAFAPAERTILQTMLEQGLNSPLTSSAGRLFDAVAAILGLCTQIRFEGEAALAVEFAARRAAKSFALPAPELIEGGEAWLADWRAMLDAMVRALHSGTPPEELASGFHEWLAIAMVAAARHVGIERIVLTGGCFQNALLSERAKGQLTAAGFRVFRHRRVPPNDGGLAVGQAAFAARTMIEEKGPCALPFPANC